MPHFLTLYDYVISSRITILRVLPLPSIHISIAPKTISFPEIGSRLRCHSCSFPPVPERRSEGTWQGTLTSLTGKAISIQTMMMVVRIAVCVWDESPRCMIAKTFGWNLHLSAKPDINRLRVMHPMIAKVPMTGRYPCSHASASACDILWALRHFLPNVAHTKRAMSVP